MQKDLSNVFDIHFATERVKNNFKRFLNRKILHFMRQTVRFIFMIFTELPGRLS